MINLFYFHSRYITVYYRLYDTSSIEIICQEVGDKIYFTFILDILLNITDCMIPLVLIYCCISDCIYICGLVEAFHSRYITEYYRSYDTSSIDLSLHFRLCVLSASWWKPFILNILLNINSSIDLSLYFRLCVLSASWWKPFILDILLNITDCTIPLVLIYRCISDCVFYLRAGGSLSFSIYY